MYVKSGKTRFSSAFPFSILEITFEIIAKGGKA